MSVTKLGNAETREFACENKTLPNKAMNPKANRITPESTKPVARPRFQPRRAKPATAGSIAIANNHESSSKNMNFWLLWNTQEATRKPTIQIAIVRKLELSAALSRAILEIGSFSVFDAMPRRYLIHALLGAVTP
jgi:hypothetical protein